MKKIMTALLASAVIGMAFGQTVRADSQSPPGKTLLVATPAPENYSFSIDASAFAQPALAYVFYKSASPPGQIGQSTAYFLKMSTNAIPATSIGSMPISTGPPQKDIAYYIITARAQAMTFTSGDSTGASTTAAINFGRGGQTFVLTTFQNSSLPC